MFFRMENFIVKLTTHFIEKFYHEITISQDLIELHLWIGEFYDRFDFKVLHNILETETKNFCNDFDSCSFNKIYKLTVLPEQKLVIVKWFKIVC